MKTILDCYQYANILNRVSSGDKLYNDVDEATKAAQIMSRDGWEFWGYDEITGEELYVMPENK